MRALFFGFVIGCMLATPASADINPLGDVVGGVAHTSVDDNPIPTLDTHGIYPKVDPIIPPLPTGAVAWWKLDEAAGQHVAHDSSGSGNDSASNGNTLDWRAPGLHISTSSTASVLTKASLGVFTQGTISVFINMDGSPINANTTSIANAYTGMVTVFPGSGLFAGNLTGSGNVVFTNVAAHANADLGSSAYSAYSTGVRTMWTSTFDGTTLSLYKDGALVSSVATHNADGNDSLGLGASSGSAGVGAVGGTYDNMVVYTRALTSLEVSTLFRALQ